LQQQHETIVRLRYGLEADCNKFDQKSAEHKLFIQLNYLQNRYAGLLTKFAVFSTDNCNRLLG